MSLPLPEFILSPPAKIVCRPDGGQLLTLTYEPTPRLLVGRWVGYANPELVQQGAWEAITFARRHPRVRAALSDSSQISGDWVELLPWLRYEFLPELMETGVQAMAFLPSVDASTRLGLAALIEVASELLPARIFELEEPARHWLTTFGDERPLSDA